MLMKFIVMFLLNTFFIFGAEMDYKYEMSQLINQIRNNAPENYLLVQQNAVDLYFEGNIIRRDWLSRIDGMSQESIFYGDPEFNDKTPKDYKKELIERYTIIKESKKPILTTNYTTGFLKKRIANKYSKKNGFINYNAPNLEASILNTKLTEENEENITKLDEVKNFLYLLNPEKFSSKTGYIETLSQTNYDLIIIDAFFKGEKITKEDIDKIKYKKNGGKRLVISYFSIGEAEDYRYYWKDEWREGNPSWIVKENENWEGNYAVEYWSDEWHKIIKDYLELTVESGFDGVFLDTVDTYYNYIYD